MRDFIGFMLVVVGALTLVLGGGCALLLSVEVGPSLALMYAFIPFIMGILLLYIGRTLSAPSAKKDTPLNKMMAQLEHEEPQEQNKTQAP